jgi:polyhydroxybutyrate depolymerase
MARSIVKFIGVLLPALASLLLAQPACALESETINVAGVERSYVYQVPKNLRRPPPLLIALHGGFGQGRGMAGLTKFALLADEMGFIAVFPDGLQRRWNDGRGQSETDDVGFINALIDRFVTRDKADPRRIYVTGISNGGMMSFRLACELPKRIAAIATVAADLPQALVDTCSNGPPLPVMMINGTEDKLMPWAGGQVINERGAILSAPQTAALFANRIGSPVETVEPLPSFANADPTRIKRHRWKLGSGPEIVLYEVEGGGHTWPGGMQYLPEAVIGRTSRQMDASRELAEFLLRFRLP